ncbi:MAG: SurA N-terminal domain-containing protein [Verrucomicrobia bacterium]|nr:SurA N-terminal domain-containing protein [Verrucomicrobiota bacterium]
MFGTIRRHQQWLWVIIIIVIIISFVVFFSPSVKFRDDGREGSFGTINGRPIKREELVAARREAYLAYRFANRTWPTRDDRDIEQQTRNRLFIAEKIRELNVKIGDAAVAEHIRRLFQGQDGAGYSQTIYDGFVKNVLPEAGLKEEDLIRFLRNELALAHLGAVGGMSGRLITPRAAETYYQRENELTVASAVFFNRSNYLATIKVTPEAVTNYFTNNLSAYHIPDRVQVSYVAWPATNYLKEASNVIAQNLTFEKQLGELYTQRGTNSFRDANDKPLPPEEGKKKLREEITQDIALRVARTNANEFAGVLYKDQNANAASLIALATERKLTVKDTEPFTEFEGPDSLKVGSAFSRAAFSLNATNNPLSSPVPGTDAIYVLAFKAHLPGENAKFENVQAKVTEDLRRAQAEDAMRDQAESFLKAATNGLAAGKTFDALCKEAKLTPTELPPFAITTTELAFPEDRIDLNSLKRLGVGTKPGTVSDFVPTREGGVILHVKARIPVPAEKMAAALPGYTEELRTYLQNKAFNEWFRKEAERSGLNMGGGER